MRTATMLRLVSVIAALVQATGLYFVVHHLLEVGPSPQAELLAALVLAGAIPPRWLDWHDEWPWRSS